MNDRRPILIGGPAHGLRLQTNGTDIRSVVFLTNGPDAERVDYTLCPSAQTGDHYVLVAPTVKIRTEVAHVSAREAQQQPSSIGLAVTRLTERLGPVLWGPRVYVEPAGGGFTVRALALTEERK